MKTVIIFVIVALASLFPLFHYTGFLQQGSIDEKDLEHWQFDEQGIIKNAGEIVLEGSSGECWIMVHGYTSTPDELRNTANVVHDRFNDTVYVPLLDGHGKVPSALQQYTVQHWYEQINATAQQHNCSYLLGSSVGAILVLKYAEEHKPKAVVLAGTALRIQPAWLPTKTIIKILQPIVGYTKRTEPGETIQDLAGRKAHITGYSFPLKGVVELIEFNKAVEKDLNKISARVLFLHSIADTVVDANAAKEAYEEILSEKRFVEVRGNHLVFRDYGKEQAIKEVINLRQKSTS